jgi:hypothetical protein
MHQAFQLRTDCGWFHVRIVYIRDILPPKGVDMDAEGALPWVRLGLSRLSEAISTEQPKVSWWLPVVSYMNLLKSRLPTGTFAVLGIALTLIVAATPVSLMYLTKDAEPLHGDWLKPIRKLASSMTPKKTTNGTTPATSESPSTTESSSTTIPDGTPAEALLRLPGASPFATPEVVAQKQIRELLGLTSAEMRRIETKADSLEPQQLQQERTRLLNQIRRKALGLLTDEQIDAWEKITDKP